MPQLQQVHFKGANFFFPMQFWYFCFNCGNLDKIYFVISYCIQIQGPLTPISQAVPQVIHGSTPLSQIGVSLTSPPQQQQVQQQQQQQQTVQSAMTPQLQQLQTDVKNVGESNQIIKMQEQK